MRRFIRYRRRSGLRGLIMIGLGVLAAAQWGTIKQRELQDEHDRAHPPKPPAAAVYKSQQDCEAATGKTCEFVMCDYAPPGKTLEEVCGGVTKGWQPMKEGAAGGEGK